MTTVCTTKINSVIIVLLKSLKDTYIITFVIWSCNSWLFICICWSSVCYMYLMITRTSYINFSSKSCIASCVYSCRIYLTTKISISPFICGFTNIISSVSISTIWKCTYKSNTVLFKSSTTIRCKKWCFYLSYKSCFSLIV